MTELNGNNLIGLRERRGDQAIIRATNPATNEHLEPDYPGVTAGVVEEACQLADSAFRAYRQTAPEPRARFLESIAAHIEALGDQLVERAMAETGLPRARIEGERGRHVQPAAHVCR